MRVYSPSHDPDWLTKGLEALKSDGYFIATGVLSEDFILSTRQAMYDVQKKIESEIGATKLSMAGEQGVLRLMMKFKPWFCKFLEFPELLSVIDATISPTAILHLQNGFILPPADGHEVSIFQNQFHMDFRRVLNKYLCSINIMFSIDAFTEENGATKIVPGSQQKMDVPSREYLEKNAISVTCPAGSMIVFDSTLWHAAGLNKSKKDRLAINHQFTRSFFKQQIDYVRALDAAIGNLAERTKQLLGWYTRVPTSLEEYYVPPKERLYRANQG